MVREPWFAFVWNEVPFEAEGVQSGCLRPIVNRE